LKPLLSYRSTGHDLDQMSITGTSRKNATRLETITRLDAGRNGLTNFIARMPKGYFTGPGKILGYLLYYFDVPHRRIVRRNLQLAYPAWTRNQIQNLSKRFFQHFGKTILELVQMSFFSREDMLADVHVEGKENLLAALARQKGVVLFSAHLGNWEMAWHVGPCYFQQQVTGVAKKLRNAQLNRIIENRRTRFGNRIIYKKGALPDMLQTLRRGETVGLLMDISRRFEGVEVNFFGRRATATPAAALLALRCKSSVVPAFCHRNPKGKLIIRIEPPVEIQRTNNLRADIQTNTQRITDRVEQAIRKNPEQWFWTLKRWKDFYPGLYPETKKREHRIKIKEKRKKNSSRTN
jgi:KDO2-lipid IV(A) lauroyltransferase